MKKILKFSAVITITIVVNVIFLNLVPHASTTAIIFFNLLLQTCLVGVIVKPTPKSI
jgi:hypothetical protein